MLSENYKVIDNYSLQQMVYAYPNSTQIWAVRHKILKKRFTFKKVKFSSYSNRQEPATPSFHRVANNEYQKLVSETNLLKKINASFAPKCYKIIKTSNNGYVVYGQFPSLTLKQYLEKHSLTYQQKNTLMQNLAAAISQTSSKSIAIIGLNLENIFVRDNLQVFFGDWTLSRILGTQQKISLSQLQIKSQFIANQIKEDRSAGVWSDIYSLGKIFKVILNYFYQTNQNEDKQNLNSLIQRMTRINYKERPSIKEVIKALEKHFSQILSKSTHSWTFQEQYTKQPLKTQGKVKQKFTIQIQSSEHLPQKQLKLVKSENNIMSQKEKKSTNHVESSQTQGSATPIIATKQLSNIKTSSQDVTSILKRAREKSEQKILKNVTSCNILNNKENKQNDQQKQIKRTNNKRNLSFFIVDLAEFVARIELNNELSFLLIKYSMLTYKETLQKWKKKQLKSKEATSLTTIMEKEIQSIEKLMNLSKEEFNTDQYKVSYSFKKELQQSNSINDALMKIKIVQFAKDILMFCQKQDIEKTFCLKKIDILYKTYLILKKIQEGSFQKFWRKVTNEDQIYLSNQKYLKQQKNYGIRYIKSKISEIISKK